jgi:hypothetical protein
MPEIMSRQSAQEERGAIELVLISFALAWDWI